MPGVHDRATMVAPSPTEIATPGTTARVLARLLRDTAGNTLALVAAALAPILAMVGGGVDMGRSYLAQSRLQQACDAGVLAARRKLGSDAAASGTIPAGVADAGNRFFNINFHDGIYGTQARDFQMTLESDYAISGEAKVTVPTTIMRIFGAGDMPLSVKCQARLNFSTTDVMMVLDTTGSMRETNPGDSAPKIDVLRDVVKEFYTQLEASKSPGTRIRYGFVPYSTNVNVGGLLHDDWVTNAWSYQSREKVGTIPYLGTYDSYENFVHTAGPDYVYKVESTYEATYHPPAAELQNASYSCDTPSPGNTLRDDYVLLSTTTTPYAGPPAGTQTTNHYQRTRNGVYYWISQNGTSCSINSVSFNGYVETFDQIRRPYLYQTDNFLYRQIPRDVSNWRAESNGCIEERSTYEINDYGNVDLGRALDLDIDLVPTNNPDTQWRPMYPSIIFERSMNWDGSGSFTPAPVTSTNTFIAPYWAGLTQCPTAARKLAEIDKPTLNSYLDSLAAGGSTYHDIGMIWGGRLLSPTGLFADENADVPGKPTSRNLIFLTDGQTEPLDLSYGTYGVEPLDQRRWSHASAQTLTQVVEGRFSVACNEVKKRNITVWLIAFGTNLNPVLTGCAGPGHYFKAADSKGLSDAFASIAQSIGDLRISK